MTLNARLWLVIITVAVSMLGLTILGAFESRAQQMRSLEGKLQSHIEAAVAVADAFRKRAAAGEMDAATAKREALREIGDMRWNGGKGYIFAFDSDMKLRLHPLRTSSIGKDISHDTDANGKPHYRIMRDADRAEGHGLTRYTQIIPKTKQTKDKISYSQWYKPWDLHLVTGAYFEDIDQAFRHQLVYNLTRTALVMLLALAVVWLTIRSIRRTIGGEPEHAVAMAERIAEGDLRGGGHDAGYREGSLLRALHHMRLRLTGIVGSVQQGSQQVSSAAQQISRGNDDLSQRPQEQASSLEETAASMEQITASVRNNASHASQADQMARGAREHAEQGGQVAEQAIAAMADISHSSHRIADIVGMIDEIAFQTNLLALNAAVEAARAGEHGRGFAVVATEVRQLAQRSAAAAKDIKTLIGESTERVQTGSDLVGRSAEALQTIVASVQKVTDLVAEISAANQEQTSGIDQVNRGVMQIDEVTQQNAALVEQVAAAARSMHEQADALAEQISYFTIDGGASAAASVQPALVRATPRGSEMALA